MGCCCQDKKYGHVILSGGLNPNTIIDAICFLHPYELDVCAGVEHTPRKLDKSLLRIFISNARNESLYDTQNREYEEEDVMRKETIDHTSTKRTQFPEKHFYKTLNKNCCVLGVAANI